MIRKSVLFAAVALVGLCLCSPANAQYDTYVWQFPVVPTNTISSSANTMKTLLSDEVDKILAAGHLRPLHVSYADRTEDGYYLYWERGRILTTLAWAYPHMTSTQQTAARTYVANELANSNYATWTWTPPSGGNNTNYMPADVGTTRELYTPAQVWNWTNFWTGTDKLGNKRPVAHTLYGLWLWAYRANDWGVVTNNWTAIKTYYSNLSSQGDIYGTMSIHIAMARMAQYMTDHGTNEATLRDSAITNLTTAFNDGKTFATIDSRCQTKYYPFVYDVAHNRGDLWPGFMFTGLSPEVGRYLKDYVSTATLDRIDDGEAFFPQWWILDSWFFARDFTGDEGVGVPSEIRGMIFPVERWVRQASADAQAGWMTSAPCGKGDCAWIENLVLAIEAYGTTTWTDVRTGGSGDTTAPTAVNNLSAPSSTSNSVTLNWTATGDDNGTGTATTYDIRYSTSTINSGNWASATPVVGETAPKAAGQAETLTVNGLNANTTYYFAMTVADEVPNTSALSNVVSKATAAASDTTAPTAVNNLSAPSSDSSSVTLNWTATGDDNGTGTASSYDIRYSTSTITDANWGSATPANGEPTPKAAGQPETFTVNGLNPSQTYYFAMKVADEVPNTSGLSNVVSKATTSGGGTNLLTDGDFQSGTTFTNATYTAGTSTDGIWYSSARWVKTADAGDAGTGDTAATVTNNWGDLRLFQGMAAPASGTQMTLSFKYVHPTANAAYIRVYGLTAGQQIVTTASGTLQGTQLFNYDFTTTSSWTSVTNQTFTVSGTYAKLVVFVSNSSDAGTKLDDVVLTGGGGDTTAPTAVNNLTAPSSDSSSVTLNWTATGDDNGTGTATTYDIRYSTSTITDANWGSATPATGEPAPKAAGQAETFTVNGLNSGVTYYFAMKVADEVPNTSGLSNVVSKATAAGGGTNLLTDGDFQSATAFTVGSYTAGTSSDGVWCGSQRWVKTADAGDGGTGDTAATVTNNWSSLRLFQGIAAPASGTSMSLAFKYVQPGSGTCVIEVYGLTSGQQISNSAGGTLQGTQLFTYNLTTASSWTTVNPQSFTVSGTYAKLVVFISVGGDAGIKVDDVVLTQP